MNLEYLRKFKGETGIRFGMFVGEYAWNDLKISLSGISTPLNLRAKICSRVKPI